MNLIAFILIPWLALTAQQKPALETVTAEHAAYVKASLTNLYYLFENIDEDKWREVLVPLGYEEKKLQERLSALHYTKGEVSGHYHVLTFDEDFMLVSLIWSDASGKTSMIGAFEKALRPYLLKSTSVNKTYSVKHGNRAYWITVSPRRIGQRLEEEVTIENAR